MKTKNNVQKAILKSAAVIVSLVLISFTVNAQNFWKSLLENETFSQIAMAMVENTEANPVSNDATNTGDADTYSELFAVEPEESLEMENWMTNEANFFESVNIETEIENGLELENWMTNESLFDGTAAYFEVETEESLEVEEWMQNQDFFGVQTLEIEAETENALELQAWMTNDKTWRM